MYQTMPPTIPNAENIIDILAGSKTIRAIPPIIKAVEIAAHCLPVSL